MRIDARPWARPSLRWGAVAAALTLAACGGSSTTTATNPNAPTTTDTFTGTLAAGGVDLQSFTVSQAGTVTVTLATVAPQSTITVGLGLGQPSGTTCTLFSTDETARMGSVETGTVDVGSYCVEIYDLGNVQTSDTFTITINHT
jgi:hypothetical protein